MRVTHPYVEVPDHSDSWMCAKDSGGMEGGGGGHSMEAVMVAVPTNSNPTHPHILSYSL